MFTAKLLYLPGFFGFRSIEGHIILSTMLSVFTVFSARTTCTQVRGSKQKSSVDKEGVDLGGGGDQYVLRFGVGGVGWAGAGRGGELIPEAFPCSSQESRHRAGGFRACCGGCLAKLLGDSM